MSLKCKMCDQWYVGQTGRDLKIRYYDHLKYIRNDNQQSAHTGHILNNRHENGQIQETKLLKEFVQGPRMYWWEALCMQTY